MAFTILQTMHYKNRTPAMNRKLTFAAAAELAFNFTRSAIEGAPYWGVLVLLAFFAGCGSNSSGGDDGQTVSSSSLEVSSSSAKQSSSSVELPNCVDILAGACNENLEKKCKASDSKLIDVKNGLECENDGKITGTFKDDRDGAEYKTVQIGEQIWMAENLNYKALGSVCYGNEAINCDKYGLLYDWDGAMAACPSGWHLPSNDEWIALTDYVGGADMAGKKLKAVIGWNSGSNGDDDYGFSLLPGGKYYEENDSFQDIGSMGTWWTATEDHISNAYYWFSGGIFNYMSALKETKEFKQYVRCVKN